MSLRLHLPNFQQCSSPLSSSFSLPPCFHVPCSQRRWPHATWSSSIACHLPQQQQSVAVIEKNETSTSVLSERKVIRFGLPSKGRMAADTLDLLKVMLLHSTSVHGTVCLFQFSVLSPHI